MLVHVTLATFDDASCGSVKTNYNSSLARVARPFSLDFKLSIMNRRKGVGLAGPSSYICSCCPYKIYPFLGDINWVVSHWAPGWHTCSLIMKGEGEWVSTSAGCFLEGVFHPICILAGIDWWGQMSIDLLRYKCWYVITLSCLSNSISQATPTFSMQYYCNFLYQ